MTVSAVYKWLQTNNKSETQEEESVGDYPNRNIENKSSNNTESLHVNIVGLDQTVVESGDRVASDEEHQSDNYIKQFVDKIKISEYNDNQNCNEIIYILFCNTTIWYLQPWCSYRTTIQSLQSIDIFVNVFLLLFVTVNVMYFMHFVHVLLLNVVQVYRRPPLSKDQ